MNADRLGRLVRTLRIRQRLTQRELAARAAVPRCAISFVECGQADRVRIGTVIAIAQALGGRLDLRLFWNGPELDRLVDAGHAAMGVALKRQLEGWGWHVRVEASFNHFGERGRIDLLAFQPAHRTVLVVELKTDLVDVQALLGSMDVRARVARSLVRGFGWEARSVVPAIVFAENRTVRNRLVELGPLFTRYELRGRGATSWLRRPVGAPTGLLWLTAMGEASTTGRIRARHRRPTGNVP